MRKSSEGGLRSRTPGANRPRTPTSTRSTSRGRSEPEAAKIYAGRPSSAGSSRGGLSGNKTPTRKRSRSQDLRGKPSGGRVASPVARAGSDRHNQELVTQLKRTNAALKRQLVQAQAQWKELQRQNKERGGDGTPRESKENRIPSKMQHALDGEYEKLKSDYHALKKKVEHVRKKLDSSQEYKLRKQLEKQDAALEKLKKDTRESEMLQRERTKTLQHADELPQMLYKLQV